MIAFLKPLLGVLTFGVTIPVWLIAVAGLWVAFDKTSEIRRAVDRAVTELVAGAELEAARAESAALALINAELKGRATALALANSRFAQSLESAQADLETANDQLAELLATPVNDQCNVDAGILGRLRSN